MPCSRPKRPRKADGGRIWWDTSALESATLFLTVQIGGDGLPVALACNMMDEATESGHSGE